MVKLSISRPRDAEAEASPELRYLRGLVAAEARRVWGEVASGGGGSGGAAGLDGDAGLESATGAQGGARVEGPSHVLLLAGDGVFVARRSLAEMRAAVEAGAAAAVAGLLSEALPAEGPGVYTLRGFERVEREILDGGGPAAPSAPAAALFTAQAWRTVTDDGGDPGTADLADLLARLPERPAVAGLCHRFVDYYGEVRADAVPHLPEGAREVLEIGCGRGATGEHLQRELGCRVTGVELNPEVARGARGRLHRVVVGDVEDPAVAAELRGGAPAGGFDALLATELFEHLVEPERFLAAARGLVRPGGRIVLSVPNVGHWSVVEDLLAGRWDYLPIGILCYTHYRFFTRRTLEDWLARCGFDRVRLVAQPTEPPPWLADGAAEIAGLEADPESLRTKGFWVLIDL